MPFPDDCNINCRRQRELIYDAVIAAGSLQTASFTFLNEVTDDVSSPELDSFGYKHGHIGILFNANSENSEAKVELQVKTSGLTGWHTLLTKDWTGVNKPGAAGNFTGIFEIDFRYYLMRIVASGLIDAQVSVDGDFCNFGSGFADVGGEEPPPMD